MVIYAYVTVDAAGKEKILQVDFPDGTFLPFTSQEFVYLERLREHAISICKSKGLRLNIAKFSFFENLEQII